MEVESHLHLRKILTSLIVLVTVILLLHVSLFADRLDNLCDLTQNHEYYVHPDHSRMNQTVVHLIRHIKNESENIDAEKKRIEFKLREARSLKNQLNEDILRIRKGNGDKDLEISLLPSQGKSRTKKRFLSIDPFSEEEINIAKMKSKNRPAVISLLGMDVLGEIMEKGDQDHTI